MAAVTAGSVSADSSNYIAGRRRKKMPIRKPKTKSGKKAVMKEEMGRFKRGQLHSGSAKGPKVKNRKQAVAIALKESGQAKKGYRKRVESAEL